MRKEDLESVKAFLREAGKPMPLREIEKQGFYQGDIISLAEYGHLHIWYELKDKKKEISTDQFLPSLHKGEAENIIKFLKNADRAVRRHELMDTLNIPENEVKYITACLAHEYITVLVTAAPDPDCKICFHRGNCEMKRTADKSGGVYNGRKPEISCNLWRHDWRLSLKKEG
jgi:hypothetical protein